MYYNAYRPKNQKGKDVYQNYACPRRGCVQIGNHKADGKAGYRNNGRTDGYGFETLKNPHGRKGRENNKAGNKHCPHHAHSQHYGKRCQKSDEHIIGTGFYPSGFCEAFIEGNGEYFVIKKDKKDKNRY